MTPQLERLVSIPEFARDRGMHRSSVFRMLLQMHGADLATGGGGWLICRGPHRKIRLHMGLLRREHPELFGLKVKTANDIDCLAESIEDIAKRLSDIEESQVFDRKRINAVAASVREVKARARALQTVAGGAAK